MPEPEEDTPYTLLLKSKLNRYLINLLDHYTIVPESQQIQIDEVNIDEKTEGGSVYISYSFIPLFKDPTDA